jgi:FMN phosphatase YigB (HAD superfamily)
MKDIAMILFDVDNTLVYGKKAALFYGQYSRIMEKSLVEALGIELFEGTKIIKEHREKYGGMGEKAFETYRLSMDLCYDELVKLDPERYLEPLPAVNKIVGSLRGEGRTIGVITDGPRPLIDRIFHAAGIDASLFDFMIGWERGSVMPKYGSGHIYEDVCERNKVARDRTVMIGDSLYTDILPAVGVGLQAVHIAKKRRPTNEPFLTLESIELLPTAKIVSQKPQS